MNTNIRHAHAGTPGCEGTTDTAIDTVLAENFQLPAIWPQLTDSERLSFVADPRAPKALLDHALDNLGDDPWFMHAVAGHPNATDEQRLRAKGA